jgi:hypothetical protein
MTWLIKLKVAIIEEDVAKIGILIGEVPAYDTIESAQEALALTGEAIKLIDSKKNEAFTAMNKIKQTKIYLDST